MNNDERVGKVENKYFEYEQKCRICGCTWFNANNKELI